MKTWNFVVAPTESFSLHTPFQVLHVHRRLTAVTKRGHSTLHKGGQFTSFSQLGEKENKIQDDDVSRYVYVHVEKSIQY